MVYLMIIWPVMVIAWCCLAVKKARARSLKVDLMIEAGLLCDYKMLNNEQRRKIWADRYGPLMINRRGDCFDNAEILEKAMNKMKLKNGKKRVLVEFKRAKK